MKTLIFSIHRFYLRHTVANNTDIAEIIAEGKRLWLQQRLKNLVCKPFGSRTKKKRR